MGLHHPFLHLNCCSVQAEKGEGQTRGDSVRGTCGVTRDLPTPAPGWLSQGLCTSHRTEPTVDHHAIDNTLRLQHSSYTKFRGTQHRTSTSWGHRALWRASVICAVEIDAEAKAAGQPEARGRAKWWLRVVGKHLRDLDQGAGSQASSTPFLRTHFLAGNAISTQEILSSLISDPSW